MDIIGVFILCFVLLGVAFGFLGAWARKHEKIKLMRGMLWGFIVFLVCFDFPLWSEPFPLQWQSLFTTVSGFGAIAAGLYGVYGEDRGPFLYPRMLLAVILGMVCRYFFEFGEVSNTYNFTPFNIIVYLLVIPVYMLLVYEFADQKKKMQE